MTVGFNGATGENTNRISVIAGLARGIDTAVHTAALEAGGRTVAVIDTGINERNGLVLSQFWPDAPPRVHQFPMRNAVMSGYGRATIVVEDTVITFCVR